MLAIRLQANNEDELKRKRTEYIAQYPPQGYSTYFQRPKQRDDGKWECVGDRAESCD